MNSGKKWAIGIDVGGTKIRAGLADRTGLLAKSIEIPTEPHSGPAGVVSRIYSLIEKILLLNDKQQADVEIGIAIPGPFDIRTGIICELPNLPAWNGFPLRDRMEVDLGKPIMLVNDADAAAIGEYFFGVVAKQKNFALLTLGTGLGSSLFLRGRPWHGISGISSELGHVPIGLTGPECSCGKTAHFESYLSTAFLFRRMEQSGFENISIRNLLDSADSGDTRALEIFHAYARYLGKALALLANLLNLPVTVLSGGLTCAWRHLSVTAMGEFKKSCFSVQAEAMNVVISSLIPDGGVLGAAMAALNRQTTGPVINCS